MIPPIHLDRRALMAGALGVGACAHGADVAIDAPQITAEGKLRLTGATAFVGAESGNGVRASIAPAVEAGVYLVYFECADARPVRAEQSFGVAFGAMPELAEGVQIWRYKPWNAWTKPIAVSNPSELEADDVQFFYWRDADGLYGAAVPLSGQGARTTLGAFDGAFAAKAASGVEMAAPGALPLIAIGYDRDPYALIAKVYKAAFAAMGRSENAVERKSFPEVLGYLGWNTWNATNLGRDLTSDFVLRTVRSLRQESVPFGWVLIDDGYFTHRNNQLQSFMPNAERFPEGFAPFVRALKQEHGVHHVGVWLALNGYWQGIDAQSTLGQSFAGELFTWQERRDRANPDSDILTNTFLRPDSPALPTFYDQHLAAMRAAGFDFIKVDNQLVVERMAIGQFPIWDMASAMHAGLNGAAARHFGGAMINCMDMTADAYFNFGSTSVARAVEDYFPYEPGENYNLQKGNAAAHVLQALYNALYFSRFSFPDFDMFESTNPNAKMHAVARAANVGPIYITDRPGTHDVDLLRSLVLSDGWALRADTPLLPTPDCLFQVQQPRLFKAFSRSGEASLLALFNLADADSVTGAVTAADLPDVAPTSFIAYDTESGRLVRFGPAQSAPVELPRFGSALWIVHRQAAGLAVFGRSDKINGAAAIERIERMASNGQQSIVCTLREGGPVAAYSETRPQSVQVDGRDVPFTYEGGLVRVNTPVTTVRSSLTIVRRL